MIRREESVSGSKRDELVIERDGAVCVLRYGLEKEALREALRRAARDTDVGHRSLAFYLAELHERGVHQLWGFATVVHFACAELELSRRQARDLVAAGRALEELPRIDGAFAEGRLCWAKVRVLCRIATPETEAAWLARALEVSSQRLEREVKGSDKGRPPREDGKGLPEVRLSVSFKGIDPVSHELYEQARSYVCAEMGEEVRPSELLRRLCSSLLEKAGEKTKTDVDPSLYRVVIDSFRDGSCAVRSEEGPIPIDRETAFEVVADRRVEKVLASAVPQVENTPLPHGQDRPIPPAMRQQVLARDGFRCLHCQRKVRLNGHHVIWRCNGGKTSPENLATLCVHCHALVHAGFLRVSGTAPHALEFTASDGRRIDRPDPSAATVRVVKEGPAGGAHASPERPKPVSFEDLPTGKTEASWWARHAHLFSLNERRRVLEFAPGTQRAVPEEAEQRKEESTGSGHRPSTLQAIVGQERVVATLKLALEGARARQQSLDHVLLEGSPGLGKTSIAGTLANEMKCRFQTTSGPLLKDVSVLCHLLTSAQAGQVMFIDEIHRLPQDVAEVLYEAMEDGTLSLPVVCGVASRTLRLELPPLTVVGATTDPDRLPRPLRDRFRIQLVLESYADADLITILEREAARSELDIEPEAAATLARAAIGTPRKALNLLRRAADSCLARTREAGEATGEVARARHLITECDARCALDALGLDERGLDPRQRKALCVLRSRRGRPIGVARLAALVDVTTRIWRTLLEPGLLRLDLIATTPRGVALVS